MYNFVHEIKLWNRQSAILPFELSVMLPAPRYARVILERDKSGRIIDSAVDPSLP